MTMKVLNRDTGMTHMETPYHNWVSFEGMESFCTFTSKKLFMPEQLNGSDNEYNYIVKTPMQYCYIYVSYSDNQSLQSQRITIKPFTEHELLLHEKTDNKNQRTYTTSSRLKSH